MPTTTKSSSTTIDPATSWVRTGHITTATVEALVITEENALEMLTLIDDLVMDDRLLRAQEVYHKLKAFLETSTTPAETQTQTQSKTETDTDPSSPASASPSSSSSPSPLETLRALLATPERQARMEQLETRAKESRISMEDLEDKSGWIFDHSLLGTQTYRRYEDGCLYVMVEQRLDRAAHPGMTVFEPLCVLKEASLYNKWSPYCSRQEVIHSYDGKGDLLNFLLFDLRVLRREIFLRTYICDDSLDGRKLLITGYSIDRPTDEPLPANCYQDCPPMFFHKMRALITHESDAVIVTIAAKMDVNTHFPRAVVDFAIRRFFQVLNYLIVRAAKGVIADPVNNVHAKLIRADPFYRHFLLPKYILMCNAYGWDFPGVSALDVVDPEGEGEKKEGGVKVREIGKGSVGVGESALATATVGTGLSAASFSTSSSSSSSSSSSVSSLDGLGGNVDVKVMKKKKRRLAPRKHLGRFFSAMAKPLSAKKALTQTHTHTHTPLQEEEEEKVVEEEEEEEEVVEEEETKEEVSQTKASHSTVTLLAAPTPTPAPAPATFLGFPVSFIVSFFLFGFFLSYSFAIYLAFKHGVPSTSATPL